MSEGRTLVVTMGKSLFASATWRCGGPFDFPRYRNWFVERDEKGRPFWLQDPERRAKDGKTCDRIRRILNDQKPETLLQLVTIGDADEPRRYCAELTTLLVLYRETEHGAKSFEEFLRGYRAIEIVCPADDEDDANIAARHLEAILLKLGVARVPAGLLRKVLRADSSRQRIKQWGEYLATLRMADVDLVVTGGYKGFALLAGDAWARAGSERGWRVIYLHQDNKTDLFVHEQGRIVIRAAGERPQPVTEPL